VNRREFVALAAAAPFAARALVAAAANAPSALVTCDAEARLAVVDLGSFRVVRSIATLPDPRAVELVGDRAVVCHTAVGPLSIVDHDGVRHVVHGLAEPRYTVAHPDGVHAFVTDSGRSGVVALDVVRGKLLGRAPLAGWARHLSIDAAGKTLWVGLGSASAEVAVVDVSNPARPRHVHTVKPPYLAHDVGFAPDGRVWVTSGEQHESGIFRAGRALVSTLPAAVANGFAPRFAAAPFSECAIRCAVAEFCAFNAARISPTAPTCESANLRSSDTYLSRLPPVRFKAVCVSIPGISSGAESAGGLCAVTTGAAATLAAAVRAGIQRSKASNSLSGSIGLAK